MIFGPVPLSEAAGTILAHSIKTEGQYFEKGRVLSADDLFLLREAGVKTVVAAKLEADDVPEDEAARRIAERLAGPGLEARAPFTGRANIHATAGGLLRLDPRTIDAVNAIDEGLTVATLSDYAAIAPGQMAATIKIIPFALPDGILVQALALIGEAQLSVAPFKPKRVALVTGLLPSLKPSVIAKTKQITEARIKALGATLASAAEVHHDSEAISEAIRHAGERGAEIILVAGAAATGDRKDTVPSAIEAAGGEIVHFGMPVDPGNLLVLGRVGAVPVVGLPGCARSPKLNGVDWILQRLIADLPITSEQIMRMGVGGLLMESPVRPQPRASKAQAATRPIGAVLLAAGLSRRMGHNKLLSPFEGEPLVRHSARTLIEAGLSPVIVVTGHEAGRIEEALQGLTLRFAHNPDYREGLASSLIEGLNALGPVEAAVIALADMPLVTPAQIRRLTAAYSPAEGRAICVPAFEGKQGNPVLWSAIFFDEMKLLAGDRGAKSLIAAHADEVAEIDVGDPGVLLDVDTPDALAQLSKGAES